MQGALLCPPSCKLPTYRNCSPRRKYTATSFPHRWWKQRCVAAKSELAARGSLVAETGKRTGRSPKDKFTVKDAITADKVAWGSVNLPFSPEKFDALYERVLDYLKDKELFVQDLFCGADPKYQLPIQVINEYAWHNLFVRQLFIRPTRRRAEDPQARVHHRQRARLPGRSQARRHQLRSISCWSTSPRSWC